MSNSKEADIWDEGFKKGVSVGAPYVLEEIQKMIEEQSANINNERLWERLDVLRQTNPYR